MVETPLGRQMRVLAVDHPRGEELRVAADALDTAVSGTNMKKTLGAWARARRIYCECTGEPLI